MEHHKNIKTLILLTSASTLNVIYPFFTIFWNNLDILKICLFWLDNHFDNCRIPLRDWMQSKNNYLFTILSAGVCLYAEAFQDIDSGSCRLISLQSASKSIDMIPERKIWKNIITNDKVIADGSYRQLATGPFNMYIGPWLDFTDSKHIIRKSGSLVMKYKR